MSAPAAAGAAGLRRELGRTGLLVAGTGLASLLGVLYVVLAGRALGPARAADFYAGLFLVFVALTLSSPLMNALTHFAAVSAARGERRRISGLRRSALRALGVAGAIAALLLLLGWRPLVALGRFEAPAALATAALAAWLAALASVDRAILRGLQRFGGYCAHLVLESGVRLGIGLLLLAGAPGAAAALAPYALAALASVALGRALLAGDAAAPAGAAQAGGGEAERGELGRFVLPMLALALADAGYQNFHVLFAKSAFEPASAGAYGAAAALARAFGALVTPFVIFALPALTAEHAGGRPTRALLGRTLGRVLALAAAPLAIVALRPHEVVRLVFGPDFAAAAPLLLPLSLATLVGFLSILVLQEFAALRRFGIAAFYLAGFGVEVACLVRWHATPMQVAGVALAAQGVVWVALLAAWLARRRGSP
jgi:O-antigen/teichoic acid export membrane protein